CRGWSRSGSWGRLRVARMEEEKQSDEFGSRIFRTETRVSRRDRIEIDPDILVGKPVVKGTRLSVDFLLGLLAGGWSEAEILRNYPGLEREDLLACWAYAAQVLSPEKVCRFQIV